MEKASDALRTISEVSKTLDVPKHVLRFWEGKFPHISPMKRGGGRRYYRPEDVLLLKGIQCLLYLDGFTIRGVQQIFKREGVDYVKARGEAVPLPQTTKAKKAATGREEGAALKKGKKPASSGDKIMLSKATVTRLLNEVKSCREILASLN